jgi:hypothetical protein
MSAVAEEVPAAEAPARTAGGQWIAGGPSPNPKGAAVATYPRDWRALRDLAQQHVPAAIDKLVSIIAKSRSQRIQLAAIELLLDRAYGKPHESLDVKGRVDTHFWNNCSPYERARRMAMVLDPAPESQRKWLSENRPIPAVALDQETDDGSHT